MPDGAKKGITVKVDAALHAEVSAFIREHGMTMSEFVASALDNELHPKITEKEGDNMANTRTVAYHAPTNFDNRWLDGIRSEVDADRLLQRLGAAQTPYGIVSKQFGSLFALTDYFEAEKFELIEVVGQPALFSDSRISDTEVPKGLHRYDLRVGDDDFCDGAIEKNVYVNYGGSILLQQPLDLGADGYIQLDEDSSPNFTGEEMTAEKFASTDFTEYDSEDFNQTGGMRL